jgi:hypothetical protein
VSTPANKAAHYEALAEFITFWWQADNINQVCAKFNMNTRTASNKAAYLRRRGCSLKSMKLRHNQNIYPPVLSNKEWASLIALSEKAKQQEKQRANAQADYLA